MAHQGCQIEGNFSQQQKKNGNGNGGFVVATEFELIKFLIESLTFVVVKCYPIDVSIIILDKQKQSNMELKTSEVAWSQIKGGKNMTSYGRLPVYL